MTIFKYQGATYNNSTTLGGVWIDNSKKTDQSLYFYILNRKLKLKIKSLNIILISNITIYVKYPNEN